jgi:hypothetical protein
MAGMGTPEGFTLDDGSFVPADVAAAALPADVPLTYGRTGGPRIGTARARLGADGIEVTARLGGDWPALAERLEGLALAPASFAFGEHDDPPGALARLAARLAPWRR